MGSPNDLKSHVMAKKKAINGGETLADSDELGREEGHTVGSSLEISDSQNSKSENLLPVFRQANPKALKPHPRNSAIYGENEDVSELLELICQSGWVKPLVITSDNVIISGHRRWKAALELGIESIPVEVYEFPDDLAELEVLLLENASRLKTTEQKVREAEAWKEVEAKKARQRMSDAAKALRQGVENFPHPDKSKTRDHIAARVGLGSGRTYSKAAKVVRTIDSLLKDSLETAQTLRKVLNERSVDAAAKLLKRISLSDKTSEACLDEGLSSTSNSYEDADSFDLQRSCWNCQHRLESVDNQSIYCNKFGILNLIDKSGDERGQECSQWRDSFSPTKQVKKQTFGLELFLPIEWQDRIEETAASLGIDAAVWITNLIGASLFSPSSSDEGSDNLAKSCRGDSDINGKHPENNLLLSHSSERVRSGCCGYKPSEETALGTPQKLTWFSTFELKLIFNRLPCTS